MSGTSDAIASGNDHKEAPLDERAVELAMDKKLARNSDTDLGTDADVSAGETETVIHESGTAPRVLNVKFGECQG